MTQTEEQKPGRVRHVHILIEINIQSSTDEATLATFGCHSLRSIYIYTYIYIDTYVNAGLTTMLR